jgi:hypothetical protein
MSARDPGLTFPTNAVAWNSLANALSFIGTDSGTGAHVECSIAAECLTAFFPVDGDDVPDLVRAFQKHRPLIERVAALTYEAASRRHPVVLRTLDVEAALMAMQVVDRLEQAAPGRDAAES